ncbi:50S ribosomal protein L36 [Arthroderma uncinatum]|uniref:50S ribosomal protein L36 n=1 Tax=Arthroderma uncinatum TaxID=74035 RepID=UPI00144AC191|nr:50S ribosomal protein L36 [Arthroderma uncinatum]KAF3491830.1 50S ribosomal protein L36 [Arthroderma uncinatum]
MSFHAPVLRAGSKFASPKTTFICSQCRNATLLRRPKRPYTFTQLIALSDGSTFTHRTTSPQAVYRSTRDTRNALLWNPSSEKLLNLEDDEAGRLAAFRNRYGRGWDSTTKISASDAEAAAAAAAADAAAVEAGEVKAETAKAPEPVVESEFEEDEDEDNLLDLISSFGQEEQTQGSKKK